MVRFTFVAAIAAAAVLGLVSSRAVRRSILAGTGVFVILIGLGLIARPSTAMLYARFVAQTLGVGSSAVPTGVAATPVSTDCPRIDENNSIEVRKVLYREWLRLVVEPDLTGIGLDGFKRLSCRPNEEVHNDILQIALEFGWPAAGLFGFLVIVEIMRLFLARNEDTARFGLFALVFLVLMGAAHGRISREFLLFFFLGYAVQFGAQLKDRPHHR
jgi:O-antigen ligase